jgi:hypothetical protein
MATPPRSMFGGAGGFFGRPLKVVGQGQAPRAAAPQSPAPAPVQPPAPRPGPFGPQRIPMGDKGDCPVCH